MRKASHCWRGPVGFIAERSSQLSGQSLYSLDRKSRDKEFMRFTTQREIATYPQLQ
jgi:hypothetical protein